MSILRTLKLAFCKECQNREALSLLKQHCEFCAEQNDIHNGLIGGAPLVPTKTTPAFRGDILADLRSAVDRVNNINNRLYDERREDFMFVMRALSVSFHVAPVKRTMDVKKAMQKLYKDVI